MPSSKAAGGTVSASSLHVLDTSALLALIEDEPGAETVERVIRSSRVVLPAVVLMEVFYILRQERGEAEAYRLYAHCREVADELVSELDEPMVLQAGRFKADHKVSLADAWIAAVARVRGATLVHKDPELEALEGLVEMHALPYKGANGG
jgi:ribonuclease VapC